MSTALTGFRLEKGNRYARAYAMYGHKKVLLEAGSDVRGIERFVKQEAANAGVSLRTETISRARRNGL